MANGEGNSRGAGHVLRVRDFLEIRTDCDGHGKEHVINHIKRCRQRGIVHQTIGDKDEYQPDIFQGQRSPLTNAMNQRTNALSEKPIEGVVDQKQQRNLRGRVAEFFDHQERCKYDKNLPSRARQKRQNVIEPVATAQD